MVLKVIDHPFAFDMKNICTAFFPYEKIKNDGEEDIVVITKRKNDTLIVDAAVFEKALRKTHRIKENEDVALAMSVLLYNTLSELLGMKSAWGVLYGVRPAKLMHRFTEDLGEQGAREYFTDKFLVSPDKVDLTIEVMKHENKVISLSQQDSFSLYVSIPFCPTRCSYCSFVSHSIERTKKLIAPYVDLLCSELKETGRIAKELGLRLETVYFGGGTPTSLDADSLTRIFSTISESFDLSQLREYTVRRADRIQ